MFAPVVSLAPPPPLVPARAAQPQRALPVGFGPGTRLRTICGQRPVEHLMAGDLLMDAQEQIVELRAMRRVRIAASDLIQIDPSAMGLGAQPGDMSRPLVVGAGQRLAMRDWRTDVIFGAPKQIQAARLVDNLHVHAGAGASGWVVQLEFDQPVVVLANGLRALVAGGSAPQRRTIVP